MPGMKCPYCAGTGTLIRPARFMSQLSGRRLDIFNALDAAGNNGLSNANLMQKFFTRQQSRITLRTTICQINKQIAPLTIVCKNHTYRIVHPGQ